MSYIRGISKTITLSTLGSAVALSTLDLNGLVESVFLQTNKAMGVGARVNVTTTSTAKVILTVKPSTLGGIYYPAAKAQTTTGGHGKLDPGRDPACGRAHPGGGHIEFGKGWRRDHLRAYLSVVSPTSGIECRVRAARGSSGRMGRAPPGAASLLPA
jgi:hypothetical protein